MLALDPARVRLDRLAAGARPALCDLLPDIMIDGVRKVSDNGVLGDPTGASAEEGRRLLESAVDALIHLLDGWEAPAA
jgi:creatinine amidohydrolase